MSATHPNRSFASGQRQLTPILVAVAITAVTVAISLAFTGLPG
jgi:hypothetical protein